ncbi:MAG TPA: transcription termination factor NusA [bacterium]|nr:transcription termination factor NusA [bacterium]HPL95730.1 transcription termination factor NusA [bacterium]
MPEELNLAIQQICDEKGLSLEVVKKTIEEALAAAFRKDFGDKKTQNIKVVFDLATGDFEVFDVKEVVEDELKEKYDLLKEEIEKMKAAGEEIKIEKQEVVEGEEEEKKFNPRTMISLSEAKEIEKKIKLGEELVRQLEVPADFGRMAAQTAKQVIVQKLREAERDTIFEQFKDKIGELILGTIQRKEGKLVVVDLGSATGIVPPTEQLRHDNYEPGVRMKFYLKSVEQTARGPEIVLSRAHPEMIRKLFKLEVPEINSGIVIIKAIARDAGFRAKIAVMAKEENLDPIGACIGQRGTRVQTVINELGGEKIDIIEWDEDLKKFISKALAPAKILKVELDEENNTAKAYVNADQYSLAIGKEGQNVRLAAKLAGLKIDIVSEEPLEKNEETATKNEENPEQVDDTETPAKEEVTPEITAEQLPKEEGQKTEE